MFQLRCHETHTHDCLTALCPGLPAWLVPKETFTHSHPSWSSDILYQLPSSTIHSILLIQLTCLTVLFHNVSTAPSWSSSWYGILCFLLCAFLHPVIIINTANIMSLIPIFLLAPYLEICLALKPCIHLTIVIWSATPFSFLTGHVSFTCNILFRTQLLHNLPWHKHPTKIVTRLVAFIHFVQ